MIYRMNLKPPDHTLRRGTVFVWETGPEFGNTVQIENGDIILDHKGIAIGVMDPEEATAVAHAILSAVAHLKTMSGEL